MNVKDDFSCPENRSFFGTGQDCFGYEKNLINRIDKIFFRIPVLQQGKPEPA